MCSKHYYASLPSSVLKNIWVGDVIFGRWSIRRQAARMHRNGSLEAEALQRVKHVIGRTDWDRACMVQLNPQAEYHYCSETLRDEFYLHKWDIDKCEKFSIFMTQASYPIKGLHFVIEAMPTILRRYPNAKLYIAGYNITAKKTIKDMLKVSSYGRYIIKLIKKYELEKDIIFLGLLNEQEICERFLKSHVFVLSSTVENESNSLSEAKILGIPSVVSFVGGVTSRIDHYEDGFAYQHDAPYMLAYYVCEIFEKRETALKLSAKAREHAIETHDAVRNVKRLLEIYHEIHMRAGQSGGNIMRAAEAL